MDYKKAIHALVDKIKSEKSLERIYKFVRSLWMNEVAEGEPGRKEESEE